MLDEVIVGGNLDLMDKLVAHDFINISLRSITIVRFADQKFAERWNLVDRCGLLQQLVSVADWSFELSGNSLTPSTPPNLRGDGALIVAVLA